MTLIIPRSGIIDTCGYRYPCILNIRLRSKTLHELLTNYFPYLIKRYFKSKRIRKTYKSRGYVRRAVTAHSLVASKKVVIDTAIHEYHARYSTFIRNLLDPLF